MKGMTPFEAEVAGSLEVIARSLRVISEPPMVTTGERGEDCAVEINPGALVAVEPDSLARIAAAAERIAASLEKMLAQEGV
jgi:hypothetical protein